MANSAREAFKPRGEEQCHGATEQMSRARGYILISLVVILVASLAGSIWYGAQWRPPSEKVERILPESDFPY